jgi:stage IV sporulation protein FB
MEWSVRVSQVKGIDIRVHVTFGLILVWAAYSWGVIYGQGWEGALFGVVATLLLFASVTLHELGHSLVAQRYGIQVRSITLLPIGGVAEMEEIPENPGQELRIAIAGPLVTFGIVAVLIVIGAVLNARAVLSVDELIGSLGKASWSGLLAYLTMANLALGLFNLIPAFPLDGGRVLRAVLAMRLDYVQATKIAVAIGQGLALLGGLLGALTGNWILVVIAIFVWFGGREEGRQVEMSAALRGVRVEQAMTRAPQMLSPHDALLRAVDLTLETAQADFPVVTDDRRLVGLLTELDLLRGLRSDTTTRVGAVMRRDSPAATPDQPLAQAQQAMRKTEATALPVVDGTGRLVGLLTAADIAEAYRLLSGVPALAARVAGREGQAILAPRPLA